MHRRLLMIIAVLPVFAIGVPSAVADGPSWIDLHNAIAPIADDAARSELNSLASELQGYEESNNATNFNLRLSFLSDRLTSMREDTFDITMAEEDAVWSELCLVTAQVQLSHLPLDFHETRDNGFNPHQHCKIRNLDFCGLEDKTCKHKVEVDKNGNGVRYWCENG